MSDRPSHLITFLGTGEYEQVSYEWPDGRRIETSLFPTALPRFLPEIRSASVFVTEKSEGKRGRDLDAEWPAPWRPEHVLIPNGSSADELWTIFDKVVGAVPGDCRVVFDITHAFRSIPLISVLAVAYLWSARDIQLQALVYGAYEAKSGDPPIAPVFDLTPMVNLLEWLAAVERFRHHLDGEPLRHLLNQIQRRAHQSQSPQAPTQRKNVGDAIDPNGVDRREGQVAATRKKEAPTQLRNAGDAISRLTNALLLGRVREVLTEAPKLLNALGNPQLHDEAGRWAKPFSHVLEPLRAVLRQIAQGPQTDLDAHYNLARFYNDRRLYVLAITLLREWIISRACQLAGLAGEQLFDAARRKEIERVLGECYEARVNNQPLPTEPAWISDFTAERAFDLWFKVPDLRNDIDHAGMRSDPIRTDRLIKNISDLFSLASGPDQEEPMPEFVFYSIGVAEPITPDAPLPPLPSIPRGSLVIIEGRAPIWRYALAWHRLHGSAAGAIAVYDPRLGAVVVASHCREFQEGQIIDVQPPAGASAEG